MLEILNLFVSNIRKIMSNKKYIFVLFYDFFLFLHVLLWPL